MNRRWRLYELLVSVVFLSVGLSVLSGLSLTLLAHQMRLNTLQSLSAHAVTLIESAKHPDYAMVEGSTHYRVDGTPSPEAADFRLSVERQFSEGSSFTTETMWVRIFEADREVLKLVLIRGTSP
jgi:Tfp pilus assembly protein PilV